LKAWALLLLLTGCTTYNRCKAGSVLLHIDLPSGVTPDQVSFGLMLALDGGAAVPKDVPAPKHQQETLEIDLSNYSSGSTLTVSLTISAMGQIIGSYSQPITLDPGCTAVTIDFNSADLATSGGEDGGSDGGDGGTVTARTCGPGNTCPGGGPCVDGYCCDSNCTGQCEACDVAGQEGHCKPVAAGDVPHISHAVCAGDSTGPCAGSCDGANTSACVFGTAECAPASCTGGVATLHKVCGGGTCPAAAADTQTCHLGACDGSTCLGVAQVASARTFVCVVLTDKTVRCWGDNSNGGVGQGGALTGVVPTPKPVATLSNVTRLAGTQTGMCALLGDGSVDCWGDGVSTPSPKPGISGATFLGGATGTHYCAIVAGGELRCWGYNDSGQLGSGAATAGMQNTPQAVCVPDGKTTPCAHATGATWVRGSDNSTCAVFSGGAVACWGSNSQGQLGPEAPITTMPSPFPQTVPGLVADSVTGGNSTVCAVSAGQALCWGGGGDTLGSSAAGSVRQPTAVCTSADCTMTLMGVTSVDTFDESACAAAAGGTVRCWGSNDTDQLGDGTPHTSKSSQGYAATITLGSGAVAVASAGQSSCAVVADRADRYLLCWGEDSDGELGDNGIAGSSTPTPVEPKWR
jgi:alpha-tubulin suppressor-like RCC1 family protein